MKVDTNTDNTEQHSKTKGGDHKDVASATKTDADLNTTSLPQQINAEKKSKCSVSKLVNWTNELKYFMDYV